LNWPMSTTNGSSDSAANARMPSLLSTVFVQPSTFGPRFTRKLSAPPFTGFAGPTIVTNWPPAGAGQRGSRSDSKPSNVAWMTRSSRASPVLSILNW